MLFLITAFLVSISQELPLRKIIVVRDITPQKMFCYENDSLVAEFLVSTGRRGYETTLGKYRILTKRPRVWSKKWKCWMLYWQSFTEPRPLRNGIHALEDQKYEKLLGYPASRGCVRLSPSNAQWLYQWTKIGDSLFIVSNKK